MASADHGEGIHNRRPRRSRDRVHFVAENRFLDVGSDRKIDLLPVRGRDQRPASHQLNRRPVLTEEVRCVVEIMRLHENAAGFSAVAVRYLKVKIEADGLRIFSDRQIIAMHLVPPGVA